MIRNCAIPPYRLRQQNIQVTNSLQLENSVHMRSAGYQFHNRPIEAEARVIPPPQIAFGGRRQENPAPPECRWKTFAPYLIPAECNKWAAIALSGGRDDQIEPRQWL